MWYNMVVSLGANTLLKKEMKVSLIVADFKLQIFNVMVFYVKNCHIFT